MIFKLRKAISFLIIAVFILSFLPTVYAENHSVKVFFEQDFNKTPNGIWDNKSGIHYYVKSDDGYGKSLAMGMDSNVALHKYFKNAQNYNVLNIKFDMKNEYQYPLFDFLLIFEPMDKFANEADYTVDALKWSVDGNPVVRGWHYDFWRNDESWVGPQGTTNWGKYTGHKWYNISIWINQHSRYVYYYMNDAFVGRTKLKDGLKTLNGIAFTSKQRDASHHFNAGISGKPELWIDNVGVYGFEGENFDEVNDVYPEELIDNVEMTFSSDPGNIFYDTDEVYFDVNYKIIGNEILNTGKIDVIYEFMDDSEKLYKSFNKTISLNGKNEISDKVIAKDLDLDYGYHIFKATVIDETGRVHKKQQKFSNLHTPEKQNNKYGFVGHYDWNYSEYSDYAEPEIGLAIEGKIGMGLTRAGITWGTMLQNSKNPEIPDWWYKHADIAAQNGITNATGVMSWNRATEQGLVPITESPPVSPEAQRKFGEYVYEYVKQAKGKQEYFELWNEYSARFSQFNLDGGTWDDYYNLMKVSYENLKKANPDAKLLGIVSARYHKEMTRRVLELGGGKYMDVMCIHPYPYNFGASPEDGRIVEQLENLREDMNDFGLQDMEIWLSEIGYSSGENYCTEEEQASYNIRTAAMIDGLVGKVWWYVGSNKDLNDDLERNFGSFRAWKDEEIPYEAKPALLAMSNWNALMTDATSVGKQKVNEDIDAYGFKLSDGKDAYVIWSRDGAKTISLKLGAQKAEVYDLYGNKGQIDALDNEFLVYVTENPMYIVGNFDGFESVTPKIRVEQEDKFGIVDNDIRVLTIVSEKENNLKIIENLPNGVELISEKLIKKGENQIQLKTDKPNGEGEIILNIGEGDKNYIHLRVGVEKSMPAEVSFKILPTATSWQGVMEITNNTRLHNVGGIFKISEPNEFSNSIGSVDIPPVAPQTKNTVRFTFPDDYSADNITISGDVEFDNGDSVKISRFTDLYQVSYAKNKPDIDGVISPNEWQTDEILITGKENYIANKQPWMGEDDLEVRAYLMWDSEYLYVGSTVDDDVLNYDREQKRIWASDSIQISVAPQRTSGALFTELGMGLIDGVPKLTRYYYIGNQAEESLDENENAEFNIVRNEQMRQTAYELKIKWEELVPEDYLIGNQDTLVLSLLINENDDGIRAGWFEFGKGVGSIKNPANFKEMPLGLKN